ncbi:hypothetical protein CRYUN_Cryun01aG0097400 [Craigia yunnanensis]
MDIVRFPKDIQVHKASKDIKKVILWESPLLNHLKFNVDGFTRGKPGSAGIGGLLKDCNTAVKVVFCKAIGVADSNVAELLAVREVVKLFAASRWASSHRWSMVGVGVHFPWWLYVSVTGLHSLRDDPAIVLGKLQFGFKAD